MKNLAKMLMVDIMDTMVGLELLVTGQMVHTIVMLCRMKGRCDVCSHIVDTSTLYSTYFDRRFAFHGRIVHLPAYQKNKFIWFIYVCEDIPCGLTYVQ